MQKESEAELKEIEAALASLVPRTDQLHRERLMYLAGRASVLAERQACRLAWAWPAAFSAMTAVAATLLVILAARPASPVAAPPSQTAMGGSVAEPGSRAAPEPQPRNSPSPAASPAIDTMAAPGDRLHPDDVGPELPYPLLLARVLERGLDAWPPEASTPAPLEGPARPSSYRELRQELLDGRPAASARVRFLPDLSLPGAKS